MSEYVKTCEKCGGNGWADPEGMAPCPICRGVGQRLIKPIPEGAVMVPSGMLVEWAKECAACLRQWLQGGRKDG